jgi:AcrR family transcriptional regulator
MVPMTTRLTRAHWIEEGLEVLRQEGPAGLAAERMAKRLGVSRGSFYWHFANALEFEAAVLVEWEERWTTRIIANANRGGAPRQKLQRLIELTGGLDATVYSSVKKMAQGHPELSDLLRRVDERRIAFVTAILEDAGIDKPTALLRAQIIYAWAMGQMLISPEGLAVSSEVAACITGFALASADAPV